MRKAIGVFFSAAVFAGCLTASATAAETDASLNKVEVKVVSVTAANALPAGSDAIYSEKKVAHLVGRPGASVLSLPSLSGSSSSPAEISLTRNATLPGLSHPRELGLKVHLDFQSNSFVALQYSNVTFVGYSKPKGGEPVINASGITTTFPIPIRFPGSAYSGEWMALPLAYGPQPVAYDSLGKPQKPQDHQLLLIRITRA